VLLPVTALFAATRAVQEALSRAREHGMPAHPGALSFSDFTDVVGLPAIERLEQRFAGA
jgi:hypothetical protein